MARRNGNGHSKESALLGDGFTALNGTFSDAVHRGRTTFETALMTFQEESFHFMNRRFEHNSHAVEENQHCKNMTDFLSAQQKWATELSKDYYKSVHK